MTEYMYSNGLPVYRREGVFRDKRAIILATHTNSQGDVSAWVVEIDEDGNTKDGVPFTTPKSMWEPVPLPVPQVGEVWGYSKGGLEWHVVAVDEKSGRWVMDEKKSINSLDRESRLSDFAYVRTLPECDLIRLRKAEEEEEEDNGW